MPYIKCNRCYGAGQIRGNKCTVCEGSGMQEQVYKTPWLAIIAIAILILCGCTSTKEMVSYDAVIRGYNKLPKQISSPVVSNLKIGDTVKLIIWRRKN